MVLYNLVTITKIIDQKTLPNLLVRILLVFQHYKLKPNKIYYVLGMQCMQL